MSSERFRPRYLGRQHIVAKLAGRLGLSEDEAKEVWVSWCLSLSRTLFRSGEVDIPGVGRLQLEPTEMHEVILEGVSYEVAARLRFKIAGHPATMAALARTVTKVLTAEKEEPGMIILEVHKRRRGIMRSRKVHQDWGNKQGNDDKSKNCYGFHVIAPLPVEIRATHQESDDHDGHGTDLPPTR